MDPELGATGVVSVPGTAAKQSRVTEAGHLIVTDELGNVVPAKDTGRTATASALRAEEPEGVTQRVVRATIIWWKGT